MPNDLQNIVLFFKQKTGFERVLGAMFDMFVQYDRVFGAARLPNPSAEEEAALSEFFKRDYYDQALIRIGLADFERQMHKYFNTAVSLEDVLSEYAGKPVKPVRGNKPGTFSSVILSEIFPQFEGTDSETWIKEISTQTRRSYRHCAELYITQPEKVTEMITTIANIVNTLEDKYYTLEEFAQKHMGTADALDFTSPYGQLFLKALACKFKQPAPDSTEDNISLHLRAKLISCGMLSSVTVKITGKQYTEVFTLENLYNLSDFSEFGKKIFIVEDPLIFAKLCTEDATIICPTNGNNAAFMYLLQQLGDTPFYYAGNKTYKGLEQADKLYLQFGKNFIPWRYSYEDYELILSEDFIFLPDEKRNLALHNETLASLLSHIKKTGKTASCMPLVPLYIEDIRRASRGI